MRLIDADKIIDSLGNSDMDFAIGAVIDEQPTVFDLDKVVKQLKDLKAMYWFSIANTGDKKLDVAYENVGNALDKVIEIVKGGGEVERGEEMNSKPTPDITPNLAISAYHVLQQYCTGQPADCKGCGFYEHCPECFQGIPCDWSLNEEGEINES